MSSVQIRVVDFKKKKKPNTHIQFDCISHGSKLCAALIWHRHNDLIFKLFHFLSNQFKISSCFFANFALAAAADTRHEQTIQMPQSFQWFQIVMNCVLWI